MRSPATSISEHPLQSWWMPFAPNRRFKAKPRLIASARGAYYTLEDGRRVFDCLSGLWCSPIGHAHSGITHAVSQQLETLDYCPFQLGHAGAFELAQRIATLAGRPNDRVFFVNSGSEAVDTALKIAIAYHRLRGESCRTRIIGRERSYHGVGLGGMSVGGILPNRKMFMPLMVPGVDHLPHTYSAPDMAFSRGQPKWGAHLADELERLIALHDASNIAAVIIEPVQGSTGVIVPPQGYLQRLRNICNRNGILMIFDEVITGFGRLGRSFAADYFEVSPEITVFAKGVTNGAVPMGGVLVSESIHDIFMSGPQDAIEFFHGYTTSAHPLAVAAAHASLDALLGERLIERADDLAPLLESGIHGLRGEPYVADIRNIGFAAALQLEPIPDQPGRRALAFFEQALEEGFLVRFTGDTIALAPPFISTPEQIKSMIEGMRRTLRSLDS